jgi:hypothetical protein
MFHYPIHLPLNSMHAGVKSEAGIKIQVNRFDGRYGWGRPRKDRKRLNLSHGF